jgi:hypothetical protein
MHHTKEMEQNSEMTEITYNIRNRKTLQNILISEKNVDTIVFQILQEFQKRAEVGYTKYGTDLDRDDLSFLEWIQHAKEEHMDAILYLEKIRQEEMRRIERTTQKMKDMSNAIDFAYFAIVALGSCSLMFVVKTAVLRVFSM